MSLVSASFSLCLFLCSAVYVVQCTPKVTQIQVLFRHGERTPLEKEIYPNDPHSISDYFPWDFGQLTNAGKWREFHIGEVLRSRYDEFLGDYSPRDVYAYSTDHDRTKISLQLLLASMYPARNYQNWNPKLPWVPIPIHYAPANLDILMLPYLCTQYKQLHDEVKQRPEVVSMLAQHNDLFEFLTTTTGVNITSTTRVYEIYNLLVAQKSMNLTLPDWCTEQIFQDMQKVAVLEYEIASYTKELKRLFGGTLVRRFVDNLGVKGRNSTNRKVYLYSSHESNIAAFLRAHDITEPALPAYGAAFILEKLEDTNGETFVRMFLWTGITEEIISLKIGNCDSLCPIDTYLNFVKDVLPSDREMNCLLDRLTYEDLVHMYDDRILLD